MGHSYLIQIGEAHGKTDEPLRILVYGIYLMTYITGRLVHGQKYFFG